ncbi:AsnC family transcriptional regulator [Kushneria sinocarnis]|uniref:AsnC family transcriptional regulator n=1 Tax=Kushneria sinocarnis TaxID=595502 RepID=A0A420WZK9_9GAMM|nr:Lrp/AsnC family transcriptional regulator [Kushneria sinocarnis]RKR06771.1 AsnC family transcriptional regulator [Kushneria sinocarnis]
MKLDRLDLRILSILSRDGRITKSRLAESINLSVSPCWERVRRLEKAGIIEGYSARINPKVQVRRTPVWIQIELDHHGLDVFERFERTMKETPEVTECVAVGGGVDYLVRVEARDIDQYQRLIDHWLVSDLAIRRYFTYIVTRTVKSEPPPLELDDSSEK